MTKKLFFLQVLMLLVAVLVPQVAWADYYFTVGDDSGNLSTSSVASVTATNPSTASYGSSGATTYYYFDQSQSFDRRFEITGTVYFILGDNASITNSAGITVAYGNTLIITTGGTSSSFSGTGTLNVDNVNSDNGNADACLGGLSGGSLGTIIIHGGNVNAISTSTKNAYSYAACIGSGNKGGTGTITIDGGKVYAANSAEVGSYAACIGSGYDCEGTMEVNIYGGEVTAYAVTSKSSSHDAYGAGIGTGYSTTSLSLNITGGNIKACGKKNGWGRASGAGIGTGALTQHSSSYKADINISGGTIYAYAACGSEDYTSAYGAGIGTGYGLFTGQTGRVAAEIMSLHREPNTSMPVTINISGGNIRAFSSADGTATGFGAGIGSGRCNALCVINITGGEITAASSELAGGRGAGIGTGRIQNTVLVQDNPSSTGYPYCEVNISGGTILAYAGGGLQGDGTGYGAGIGTGAVEEELTAKINITGGDVTAYSCYGDGGGDGDTKGKGYGAGIGTGRGSAKVTCAINISDGTVKSVSSRDYIGYGAGIGAGDNCNGSNLYVKISGGTVNACSGENYKGWWNHDGAGIGGGEDGGCDSVIITGGNVKAYCCFASGAGMNAAGIGNGEHGEDCQLVSITGDETMVTVLGYKSLWANKVTATAKASTNVALAQIGEEGESITETQTDYSLDLTTKGSNNKYMKITFNPLDGKVVYYKDEKGKVQSCQAKKLTEGGTYKGYYYVDDSYTVSRITVSDTLHLILLDGCSLTANGCIVVENSNSLVITTGNTTEDIAGTGKLYVNDETGGNDGDDARIGSRENQGCGYVTINGGNITVYSTFKGSTSIYGADIGSGYKGDQGCIIINDGKVWCYGGYYGTEKENSMCAASIGSGYEAESATVWIRINGGRVQAWPAGNKTSWGAGIGTGGSAKGRADIIINGGYVDAESSTNYCGYGAGIGTGDDYSASGNTTIEIHGGYISAYSCGRGDSKQAYGAGIGMGDAWDDDYGKVDITITGGTVHAQSGTYYAYGAGIGGGDDGGCGTITISGNAKVQAFNCSTNYTPEGAGIGDGDYHESGSLTIYGDQCVVDTWGEYGIGHTIDGNFSATVYPMGGTIKLESGNVSYGNNNDNSPQYFTSSTSISYGDSKWRKVSFETTTKDVYYNDEDGKVVGPVTAINCTTGFPMVLGGDSTKTTYYYTDATFSASIRSEVKNNAMLILGDNAQATTTAGITVEDDNTFTITSGGEATDYAGTGTLTVNLSSGENAAIGSRTPDDNNEHSCGNIIINGGTINASAYFTGAGIGSGKNSPEGGSITINDGTVTAYAGSSTDSGNYGEAAGIGGGRNCTNPDIFINGGTVKAYSAKSKAALGAGIGSGNHAAPGNITITGGTILAGSSENWYSYGAGIGAGNSALDFSWDNFTTFYEGGIVKIYGDKADVTVKTTHPGYAIIASTVIAAGANGNAIVDYGKSSSSYSTYTAREVDLNNMNNDTISKFPYAHIYFEKRSVGVYYTQEDGSVSENAVEVEECSAYLPKTLGDGTDTPVYYYLYGKPEQNYRSVVNGNAVLILADDCEASIVGGITVEEGNTLTITAGDTTKVYDGTGSIDVVSNDGNNAAIGSLQPSGESSDYAGHTAGTINIYDGIVVAHVVEEGSDSETYAAAIGGGAGNGNAGTINITGGIVKAYSAYSGTGNGAGIGGGNGEWFGRKDGGMGGTITISGDAFVQAYSSVSGSAAAAGIGYGRYANSLSGYTGTIAIKGDSAEVIAKGECAFYATEGIATPAEAKTLVDYGESKESFETYSYDGEVNLFDFNGTSLKSVKYGKVYFYLEIITIDLYYTQEDGSVSEEPITNFKTELTDTLGDGTSEPVYYYLTGEIEYTNRLAVNGNAVLILDDSCHVNLTSGITVEEGNTLTITTGDTTRVYEGTGIMDVGSNDGNNAAIGSTQPDGNSINYPGHTAGTINIYDGTITAHVAAEGSDTETFAAAIGGGAGNGNAGTINITGGTVTAYSAYSGTGNGAGIGGGNGEWFARKDGGFGGMVTISGNANVKAYSSVTGTAAAAGIGYGRYANDLTDYTGTVTIKGDSAVVVAQGECAIFGITGTATPAELKTIVDYGETEESLTSYSYKGEVNLFDFNSTSLKDVKYAKVYFATNLLYYTQEDGTVISEPVLSFQTALTGTLGDGTENPVYYFLTGETSYDNRLVVNGNAVIVLGDGCQTKANAGITVEEGNTLTITTGDTTQVYEGTGSLLAGSNDANNAAIGSTMPDGNSKDYGGHTAGTINIYDGNITAHVAAEGSDTETFAAAIGGGAGNGNAGTINITGGTVKAYSAYSGTGNGAGIGGGNGEWFSRMDGGFGGTITISGTAQVEAYSSVTGTAAAAGIGYGRYATRLSNYTGTVTIKGDSTVVVAQGECAIYATAATATPDEMLAMVDYGETADSYNTYSYAGEVNLLDFNSTSLKDVKYGKVYFNFSQSTIDVYYTQADGSVSDTTVNAYDCSMQLPDTLGDGTETPVYYYLTGTTEFTTRPVVNGNAVIVLADSCNASITGGITVEEGNTLTITTGDTTQVYAGTGKLDACSNDTYSAAIGAAKPDGESSDFEGHTAGTINIYDGTIVAHVVAEGSTDDAYAAAIGGGAGGNNYTGGNAGIVNITGGNVTAYCAYSGNGYGAGIGGGNSNKGTLGGIGDDVTISGNAHVEAYSSYKGTSWGDGIGCGNNGVLVYNYISRVVIYGDSAVVIAKGVTAIRGRETFACPDNLAAIVDYGDSEESYSTYASDRDIFLSDPAADTDLPDCSLLSLENFKYAKVYFGKVNHLYYTQEDGSIGSTPIVSTKTALSETLGDGTDNLVYYYLTGETEYTNRLVVNGNAVIVLGDSCKASLTAGITVEEGNTLTITAGDTTNVYQSTGLLTAGSNDSNNAAIGSTQPDGNASSYAGHTAGTINIYDGTVVAHVAEEGSNSETFAAAIGGGAGNGNAGTINITGGTVQAYSAYAGTGNGAGIGGGNAEWFGRKDGGFGGKVTISGTANVKAYSSVTGTSNSAGIGFGRYANELSDYTGTVTITGDSAVVIAKGACAIYGTAATATPVEMLTMVDYGETADSYDTYRYGGEVNLLDFNGTSLSTVKYGKVYFAEPEAITLAEALDSVENVTYTISDNLIIVETTNADSILWCTDGKGNWVKVASDDYETLKSAGLLQGGTIQGQMSDLDTNPVLTLSKTPSTLNGDKYNNIANYNVAKSFSEAQPDEIATFTGYYFVEDGTPKFRGFGGTNPNHKGQSLVLDLTLYVGEVQMTEGNLYTLRCAVQINEAWDEEESTSNAPRRVSKSDGDTYFTNYTAYALERPQEVTGITENMLNKEVDHIDYVNTIGQVSEEPWEGMNIVVTHFTDGTTTSTKVVK